MYIQYSSGGGGGGSKQYKLTQQRKKGVSSLSLFKDNSHLTCQ